MKQKFKNWIKNLDGLVWMRLWAAMILIIYSYWIFSDREIDFGKYSIMYLPWIYFYYTDLYITKKIVILLVPLLINIALWFPCHRSYLFIRVVLYAERIISIFWALLMFGSLWIILLAHGSAADLFMVSGICIFFNELMLAEVKKEKFKEKFSAMLNLKTDKETTLLTRKLAVVFYITIFLLLSGENLLQKKLPTDDFQVETRNVVKLIKENTVEEIPYSKVWRTKLSRDEKLLLLKVPSYKEEGNNKNMFVIDFASMETINILQSSNSANKNYNDYEFTPDNKYVIVGNRVLDNSKIKFTVLNIATGEADLRFSDPQGLLENLPKDIDEIPLIRFNSSGDYFAIVSEVKHPDYRLEFWDYKQGILIHVENIKGSIYDLIWLDDRKCIILHNNYDKQTKKESVAVEQREILSDISVLTTVKEKITAEVQNQNWSHLLKRSSFLNVDHKGKYISILIDEKEMKVWDLDTEENIFSLSSDNEIKDVLFQPDSQQLMVFELLKDERNRITFWDIDTKKKQKRFFIKSPIIWRGDAVLIDNGKKLLLNGKESNIVFLKDMLGKTQ